MRTIYLRNVPDEVANGLERLAKRSGMSLNAFSVRELAEVSRRADNAALFDGLPSIDVDIADVVESLDQSRAAR
ncbi:antitoxin VapB9 [soil metagenome]